MASNPEAICIFCFRSESDKRPWCSDKPGQNCTYGLAHEYPCAVCRNLFCKVHVPGQEDKPKQPARKADKQLCTKCGVHVRNPASATNGCVHEYPQ